MLLESVNGARSRNRTGTVFLPRDFKSLASTNFAIRAERLNVQIVTIYRSCQRAALVLAVASDVLSPVTLVLPAHRLPISPSGQNVLTYKL